MGTAEELLEMGFSQNKVQRALAATKNAGLQPAIEWLVEHNDDPDDMPMDESSSAPAPAPATSGSGAAPINVDDDEDDDEALAAKLAANEGGEAKSLKCLQCGKTFRDAALASYHGDKSGHDQFEESTEEIKPLTPEEKAQRLQELRDRMAAKKKVKAKRDAEEARENERIRRKAGQDQAQARAELQIKEAEKQAMMRKRERIEEAKAKDRVRQQIEADKRARAEKAAREKELRERGPTDVSAVAAGQSATKTGGAATATGGSSKNYDSARLQIRKQGLPPMTTTMEGTKTLKDVEAFVREQQPSLGEVVFSSTFPRKTYGPAEMGKTLQELGLCPSAALMLQ